MTPAILIGVISDTHGLLRAEALAALHGAQHIIHAGDVGAPEVLDQLRAIVPVTAVRGNVDKGAWARKLQDTEIVEIGGVSIYVLHDLARLDLKPEAAYFTERDGRRGGIFVVDLQSASDIPKLAEPWFLSFNAEVEFRIAMTPEDLAHADLNALGKKWA